MSVVAKITFYSELSFPPAWGSFCKFLCETVLASTFLRKMDFKKNALNQKFKNRFAKRALELWLLVAYCLELTAATHWNARLFRVFFVRFPFWGWNMKTTGFWPSKLKSEEKWFWLAIIIFHWRTFGGEIRRIFHASRSGKFLHIKKESPEYHDHTTYVIS